MNNWEKTTLGEVVEIIDGDRGNNYPKNDEFLKDGYCLFLNTKNVPNTNFSFKEKMFISKEKDNILRKGKLQRHDYILTTRGTIGNFAFYSDNIQFENIRINSGMVILRVGKNIDVAYLGCYLKSYFFQHQVQQLTSGTAQPQLPIRDLKIFNIILPSISEQKAIAKVLSSLDDKIELLRKQNETLEKIAQTIFKRWFVEFDFSNKDGKPYKLSGGKMIESELGEIPERWRVGKIFEAGKVICGKTPPKADPENFGGDIPFIKIPDMHNQIYIIKTEDSLTEKGAESQKTKYLPVNSICVSCIATVGLVVITTENSQTNQQINSIIPNDENLFEYLFFVMRKMSSELQSIGSSGTATLNINTGTFMNLDILLPPKDLLNKFHEIVNPNFEKIKYNTLQIQTLSRLRDTLLPKLMSGGIKIHT